MERAMLRVTLRDKNRNEEILRRTKVIYIASRVGDTNKSYHIIKAGHIDRRIDNQWGVVVNVSSRSVGMPHPMD